jgi:hypothetical protein
MSLQRRPNATVKGPNATVKEEEEAWIPVQDDNEERLHDDSKNMKRSPPPRSWMQNPAYFLLFWAAMQVTMCLVAFRKLPIRSTSHFVAVVLTVIVVSLPVFLALGTGLGVFGSHIQHPHQRYIPLLLVASILGNQLPALLTSGFTTCALVVFGLASRPMPQKEGVKAKKSKDAEIKSALTGPLAAVASAVLMVAVMLTENFLIWVVSATYYPSQNVKTLPQPLQDNGQIVLSYFFSQIIHMTKRNVVVLRNMVDVQWVLVAGLGLSCVAVELQGKKLGRNLWGLAIRALLTMSMARFVRTISFMITVLPSQNKMCYFSHFPTPPPQEWLSWIVVGFTPQVHGGCNDLIISGHATVTATLACVVTSVVGRPMFTVALWLLVSMDYMVEIYEGFHYSVDMWLGAVLVNFIWTSFAFIEERNISDSESPDREFVSLDKVTKKDIMMYVLPAFGSYLQVTKIVPQGVANHMIVLYTLVAIAQITKFGFQQYTQHCLFCLLYLGLGAFL